MSERTISPVIAKMMFGDHTFCGASKMVFTEHEGRTLYGGVATPNISTTKENWHMAVGSLIFVPLKIYDWKEGLCSWSIEDLLVGDGLASYNWKEQDHD